MTGQEFAVKLHQGEMLFGTRITSATPPWTNLAKKLNLDFVFIDSEHHPFTPQEIAALCHIHALQGIIPMVRIPRPDATMASMALDWGALSIVAPYVETVEQVIELVGAVKYKPLKGRCLSEGLSRNQWHADTKRYLVERNIHRSVIINIESVPALEILDQLTSVDGLDAVLIGPHDLSISLGIPEQYEHSLFVSNVKKVVETARSHKIGAGIHTRWQPEQGKELMNLGLNLIIHIEDYEAAIATMQTDLRILGKRN